ncbi:MAG: ABC transporter permease [Nitrospirota bacterium]|nr:ABC transporter permease [Nitrospirota bacterium]
MPFPLLVAVRYLKAKKRHRALAVNTVVSVVGVMCGVAALIATLAVMNGAMEEIRDKILGTNSHVVVTHGSALSDYPSALERVARTPGVVAAAPFIYGQALITTDLGVQGVVLRGVDPREEGRVTDLERNMVAGELGGLSEPTVPGFGLFEGDDPAPGEAAAMSQPGIILGQELAIKLGVMMGTSISVISPAGEMGPMGIIPRIRPFTVVGIFSSGMYEYDASIAYVSLTDAQDFLQMGDRVTGVEVRVVDFEAAPQVARDLRDALGLDFTVRDWRDLNRNFFEALALEKAVMFIILTLIIVVAAFNIIGTLVMMVLEKGREIAILKAMGATGGDILKVFTLIGLMIGGAGVALGLPLGLSLCWAVMNMYELPGDVYYISHIPVHLVWSDAVAVCGAAMLISLLAALYPAWQAGRMSPADGLRYE